MAFFKNLKLSKKLTVGFAAITLVLIITVLFGFFGLNKMNDNFEHYREIANEDAMIGKLQTDLLESRLAFKNYVEFSDVKYQKSFETHFSDIEELNQALKHDINSYDREKGIDEIIAYLNEYRDKFEKVVELTEARDDIYNNILNVKGPEIEQKFSLIMDSFPDNNNDTVYFAASNAMKKLLLARMHVVKFLLLNEVIEKENAKQDLSEIDPWLTDAIQSTTDKELKASFEEIRSELSIYSQEFEHITTITQDRNLIINRMDEIGPLITVTTKNIQLSINTEQNQMNPIVAKTNQDAIVGMVIMTLCALIVSVFITVIIVRIVVIPVKTVTNTFKEVSEGEANLEVRLKAGSKDELGDMALFFNRFMNKLETILLFNKNQNWLKTGQTELNEKIRGEQVIDTLVTNVITYVAQYVKAQIGAIYIKRDDNSYKMVGSYAYKRRKNLSDTILLGEGLVGQAALEKKTIVITNVPEDYIQISSGVGEAQPTSILVTPCMINNQVKCLIELGSFNGFSDIELEFIEQISESIAISLEVVEANLRMKDLLDKSLEQSEELQVQQEELKQSNEELEEQAKALKQSEAKLQAQQEELRQSNEELEEQARALKESEAKLQSGQEELRVINEELEERTKSLEMQKNDVFNKNQILTHAQKEIKEKAEALEVTSKYKSEFLANMSHELRTPLNSILVLSQMLAEKKESAPLSQKQLEFAKTIHSSGQDLLKLINDILDLSKVEAGKLETVMEEFEISELMQMIEGTFRPIALQKGLQFVVNISEDLPIRIVSDIQRVQQIINNLLSNAFKFTKEGRVTVTIDSASKEVGVGLIRIAVSDTGVGIAKEKQGIIFEAFKQSDGTTSRKYGGTGLGLSISKDLAALLGGKISVQSELGDGSIFTLYLPQVHKQISSIELVAATNEVDKVVLDLSEKVTEITDDREAVNKNDKLLLVIEDDESFSSILSELAHEKGYKCITSTGGEAGFKLAEKYRPDAILMDIGLPDINGWKVIEKLKMEPSTKKIPVHVISGGELKNSAHNKEGIVGFLKKPVSLESLGAVFKKIEGAIERPFKKILIADDNKQQVDAISEMLGSKDIQFISLSRGQDIVNLLKKEQVDCMILDLMLQDMSGYELLQKLKDEMKDDLPVIIHTEKILTQEDESELRKYTDSIIIKGSRSIDRLVAEASLFLHDVDSKIEDKKMKAIKSEQEKEDALKNKKILVVDDDMRNVFALSSVLEEKGMKVVVGRHGKEGILKLEQNPDVNLILMDIMMPEMDGYAAMREIRSMEKFRKVPIIALTAKAMKDDKQKCIEAGANDYLTKPLDIDKLTSLLRVWLYK